jgi:hypothetical protein
MKVGKKIAILKMKIVIIFRASEGSIFFGRYVIMLSNAFRHLK